jgi:hypothetical protein
MGCGDSDTGDRPVRGPFEDDEYDEDEIDELLEEELGE